MAALEHKMESRWEFCILHMLVLFHSVTLISFVRRVLCKSSLRLQWSVQFNPYWHRNGKSRGESSFNSIMQSTWKRIDSFRTALANVWFHLLCLFDCNAMPFFQVPKDVSFSKKWDHTLNTVMLIRCCHSQNVNSGGDSFSLPNWHFSWWFMKCFSALCSVFTILFTFFLDIDQSTLMLSLWQFQGHSSCLDSDLWISYNQ